MPARCRPALYLETFYNVGAGAFISLFLLSGVVLKTVIDGSAGHLALLAAMFGGSSLLSPLVSYCGRSIPMRTLVVVPNFIVALLLVATISSYGGATFFAAVVGGAFIFRVFPRVSEMNMYRVLYPATHRGAAVGWIKAVSAIAALSVTVMGYWWFSFQPAYYWVPYWLVAALLVGSALCYARIPISRNNVFARAEQVAPHRAFWEGVRIFLSDRRFVMYQIGFSFAGFANHMAMIYVAQVLKEDVLEFRSLEQLVPGALRNLILVSWGLDRETVVTMIVGFIFAVLPVFLMMTSAPFWGRFLDRINPMSARALFNSFQTVAYGLHAYGGLTLQVWPILLGAAIHAISNGGGTINWLTGSLYFARSEHTSLYNAVHVGLTGVRGMIAPIFGWYLYLDEIDLFGGAVRFKGAGLGAGMFWVAMGLSLLGAVFMFWQGLTDPGRRE